MRSRVNNIRIANGLHSAAIRKRTVMLVVATAMALTSSVLGQASRPAAPGPSPAPPLSQTREATGLLKVTCDPTILPVDAQTLQVLLQSPGVLRRAARDAFSAYPEMAATSPEEFGVIIRLEPIGAASVATTRPATTVQSGGPAPLSDTYVGAIHVNLSAFDQGAVEVLSHISAPLQAALNQAYENRVFELDEEVKDAIEQSQRMEQDLQRSAKHQSQFRREFKTSDLSSEALLARSNDLEKEKQRLGMEVAGMEARQHAIQQRIAVIGARATASGPETDPMVQALKIKLDSMRKKHEALEKQRAAGLVGAGEPDFAAEVAMAEMELSQQIRRAAGGESLVKLNDDLAEVSIDAAQKQAQLEQVTKQLETIGDLLDRVDTSFIREAVVQKVARQAYEAALTREHEIKRMRQSLRPPTVLLVGDVNEKK